jgi:hypothetical protein
LLVCAWFPVNCRLVEFGLACATLFGSVDAALSVNCKPDHYRAPYFLNNMGACAFKPETLSFAGTPAEQAMCLMRGMDATRNLGPPLQSLPAALTGRVGQPGGLPSREILSEFLSRQNLEWKFAANLWQPLSRGSDNDADAPMARYFVIHDTSGPNFHRRSFPDDIDGGAGFNNLANFVCADGWGKAHVVVNRAGDMLLDHEFAIPWRETKFEQAAEFGGALKGLFLHVELIQPRGAGARGGDSRSPDPAFSPAQYDRLALLYTIASVRAGRWLIPAFHAALDATIRDGHDDPLNFDIDSFAASLDRLADRLQHPEQIEASIGAPVTDAPSRIPAIPFAVTAVDDPPPAEETVAPQAAADAVLKSAALAAPTNDAASKPAPAGAMVAAKESESHSGQQTVSAEHCTTHSLRGHRRRLCEPDRAENVERGGSTVRPVDRELPQQSRRSRHHGRYVHARHGRGAA